LSFCLSLYPSVYLSVCPLLCLSYPSVCLSINQSAPLTLSI
jgi:hypothetical protein